VATLPTAALEVKALARSIHFQLDPTKMGSPGAGFTGATIEWAEVGGAYAPGLDFVRTCELTQADWDNFKVPGLYVDPRWGTILPGAEEGTTYLYRICTFGTGFDDYEGTVTTRSATAPAYTESVTSLTTASTVRTVVNAALSSTPASNRGKVFEFAAGTYRQAPFTNASPLTKGGDVNGWVTFRPKAGADGQVIFDGSDPTYDVIGGGLWTKYTTSPITTGMNIYRTPWSALDPGHIYYEDANGNPCRLLWASRDQMAGGSMDYWSSGLYTLNSAGTAAGTGYAVAHGRKYDDSMQIRAGTVPEEGCYCVQDGYMYVHLPGGIDPETVKMKIPSLDTPFTILGANYVKVQGVTFQYFGLWSGTKMGGPGDMEPKGGILVDNSTGCTFEDVTMKGFGIAAFADYSNSFRLNDVLFKNCKAYQYGIDPHRGVLHSWHRVKASNTEAYGWWIRGEGISVIDCEVRGTFNGIDTGCYHSSGYETNTNKFSQFVEVDNCTFDGIPDDAVEPDLFTTSFVASRNKLLYCYKGISLAPMESGPAICVRNTYYSTGFYGNPPQKEAGSKFGNDTYRDVGWKLYAHNTIANAHTDWQNAPGVGLSAEGQTQNLNVYNNYVFSDYASVDFANSRMGYPHSFDSNFYATPGETMVASGIGIWSYGYFALAKGQYLQGDLWVTRGYSTFTDWQQGNDTYGANDLPGYFAGITPSVSVTSNTAGTTVNGVYYPPQASGWLHDPNSVYEERATSGLTAPEAGDFSIAGFDSRIAAGTLPFGKSLNSININCLPGWKAYEEAAPTIGAVPSGIVSVDTYPPTSCTLAVSNITNTGFNVTVSAGSDDTGIASRVLTVYSDPIFVTQVGLSVTLSSAQTVVPITGLTKNTPYYVRCVWTDYAGNETVTPVGTQTLNMDDSAPTSCTLGVSGETSSSFVVAVSEGSDDVAVTSRMLSVYSDSDRTTLVDIPVALPAGTTSIVVTGLDSETTYYIGCVWADAAGNTTTTLSTGTTTAVAPPVYTATRLVITTQPGYNLTTQPVISAQDADGHVCPTHATDVTVSLVEAGTLSGTLTATPVDGVATFTDLSIATPGTYHLTFSSGALTTATSNAFIVPAAYDSTPPTAGEFTVTTTTDNAIGGTIGAGSDNVGVTSRQVWVYDSTEEGNLLRVLDIADGETTWLVTNLPADSTYPLVAHWYDAARNDTAVSIAGTKTSNYTATKLSVSTQPRYNFTTQPIVRAVNASGFLDTTYTTDVAASLVGAGTLSGTTTVTPVGGVATFTDLSATAGTHTLRFTSGTLTSTTSSEFIVPTTPDIVAPTGCTITAPTVTDTTISGVMSAGSDASGIVNRRVVLMDSDQVDTLQEVVLTTGQTAYTFTGLTPETTYDVLGWWYDAALNTTTVYVDNVTTTATPTGDVTAPTDCELLPLSATESTINGYMSRGTDVSAVTRTVTVYSDSERTVEAGSATVTGDFIAWTVAGLATDTDYYIRGVWTDASGNLTTVDTTYSTTSADGGGTTVAVSNTYATILAMAKQKVGTPYGTTDNYTSEWPGFISAARDEVAARLALSSGTVLSNETQIAVVSGQREYDLTTYGFLGVERIWFGTATDRDELTIMTEQQAVQFAGENPDATGTPVVAYLDGLVTVGIVPVSTDTTQKIIVQGPNLANAMTSASDASLLPVICNELIAYGAAIRCIEWDFTREDLYSRYDRYKVTFEEKMRTAKILASRMGPTVSMILTDDASDRYGDEMD
jgi:hypothetical protein